jgi:GTP:adenosylcobinamide-phosphate guanylyltransferase
MLTPVNTSRPPVVILAHGLGTRLSRAASGVHKTTEQVHRRPVLDWLLREVACTGLLGRTIVTVREDDPGVRDVVAAWGFDVEIQRRCPQGYLRDVYAMSRICGRRFTVVEADTVAYPGSLRNFLILAERLSAVADLCVGVGPASSNPNGPAVVVDADGRVTAMRWRSEPTGLVPLGAWHWSTRLLDEAATFCQRSTSVADYVNWVVPRGATILPIGLPAGYNINTPDDLQAARHGVGRWYGQHLSPTNPTSPLHREGT